MRWLKRERRKASIALAGMLLLLVLMVWVPVSAAGAYEGTSGLATPVTGTVQAMPTEDATVTALNKEKLAQEVQQLKNQNEPDPFGWLRTNVSIFLSTLIVVIGGLFGFWRWRVDRQDAQARELKDRRDAQDKELEDRKVEREKRAEEQNRWLEDRQAERERRDEEQQHWLKDQEAEREKRAEERFQSVVEGLGSTSTATQVGAAIMLRTFLRPGYEQFYSQVFDLAVAYLRLRSVGPEPEPADSLNQALIRVFRESFPLARDEWIKKRKEEPFDPQSLDALGIQLDSAYLARSDLRSARMPEAYLRRANLVEANLSGAKLRDTNLSGADLQRANLSGADLRRANLSEAGLKDAKLYGVRGLTKEQLETCKAKGAMIDEDSMVSSSQSTVSASLPSQSNDMQVPSALPAQKSDPTPVTGGSNTPSSQQSNGTQAQSALSAQMNAHIPDADGSSVTPSQQGPEP